jgi:hypothetical protein
MDEINPTDERPAEVVEAADVIQPKAYRPWSRRRVWAIFILGMHSAGFMTFFFHPVFAFFGLGCGLPAVILSGMEIRDFPEARNAGPVKWGRITGFIGLIGGPISVLLFGVIIACIMS